jgi:GDP-L-fucose synthase
MDLNAKIFVAGHGGLAGSAISRRLKAKGYRNIITRTHAKLELTEADAVRAFFEAERPDYVFLAAARVGGILANRDHPAEFIQANLAIQTNVIHESWKSGVKRLLFLGSSCVYPRLCPQPMKEEYLLTGPLEPTNQAYAIAKIAGIEMCWAYNRQYATRFVTVMPPNLYGPGDNYDLESSHFLPALIRKTHEAKARGASEVEVWGTGTPRREVLYSDDMADACVLVMGLDNERLRALFPDDRPPLINIGCGEDLTIREFAETVSRVVGFRGRLRFDPSKPDGMPRKILDVSKARKLGWKPRVSLDEGVRLAYQDFQARLKSAAVS